MVRITVLSITLLVSATTGIADTGAAQRGIDFSKPLALGSLDASSLLMIGTDSAGAIYIAFASNVFKLSPGGDNLVYSMPLGFQPVAMTVDSAGDVFVAGQNLVARLNASGSGFAYQTPVGDGLFVNGLAADNAGHAYVAGSDSMGRVFVARLTTDGAGFDYLTYPDSSNPQTPAGIAVDASGAVFIASNGSGIGAARMTRLAPDGSTVLYSIVTGGLGDQAQAVAADPGGNAVLYQQSTDGRLLLLHLDPDGNVTFSKTLPSFSTARSSGRVLRMDDAGNTYFIGYANAANFPIRNTLAPCGSFYLAVLDSSGDLVQSTYIPGAAGVLSMASALALGPNSTVYVGALAESDSPLFLARLSPNTTAQPLPLACIGNAGSLDAGPVTGGELVSLFGEGLGPMEGTTTADVQVTFDGMPAQLLYAQDGQINAMAPWSLAEGETTEICAWIHKAQTNCLTRPVAKAAPGVFTTDGRHAAALNEDGTINSADNPAGPGSIVSIFATGLGPASLPVKVGHTIGGIIFSNVPEDPRYVGPDPLQPGVSRIDFAASASPSFVAVGADFYRDSVHSPYFTIYVASQ